MLEAWKVRLNYLAILVSALVYFGIDAMWFTIFLRQWLAGNRLTLDQLEQYGQRPWHGQIIAYIVFFVGALVTATIISWLTQMTGRQTLVRGAMIGLLGWIGFVLTTFSSEYAFEARAWRSVAINTGASLIGMVVMGMIVGAWKAKPKTAVTV